jgi:NTE family protein
MPSKTDAVARLLAVSCLLLCLYNSCSRPAQSKDTDQILTKPIVAIPPIVKQNDKQKVIDQSTKVETLADPPLTPIDHSKRPTIALALGGGGTRGAAHIGVIRALNQAGVPIDEIVGCSMGAVVGGLYAAGLPIDDVQNILLDKSLAKAYIPAPFKVRFLQMPFVRLCDQLTHRYAGFYSGTKFQKYLESKIPTNCRSFDNLKIPFLAVATNLLDGKAYALSSGNLAAAIHASSAISPLLKPIAIDDKLFVDGGVRANLPACAARDSGADLVIAVVADEPLQPVSAERFTHMRNIAIRTADIVLAVNDDHQIPFADVIIYPDVHSIPVLTNNPEYVRRAIKAGELAGERAIPTILRLIKEKEAAQSRTASLSGTK